MLYQVMNLLNLLFKNFKVIQAQLVTCYSKGIFCTVCTVVSLAYMCVCTCVSVTLARVCCNSSRESITETLTWCIESPYCFWWRSKVIQGHREKTLKTLLTQHLLIRSLDRFHTWYVDALWVTWGQTLNLVLTQYLKVLLEA